MRAAAALFLLLPSDDPGEEKSDGEEYYGKNKYQSQDVIERFIRDKDTLAFGLQQEYHGCRNSTLELI